MIKVKFIQTHPDAKLPTRNNHGMLDESIPIDDSQEQATFGFYRLRNNGDTGYDLYAVDDVKIPGMGIAVHGQDLSVNSAVVPVGLKLAEIEDGYWFRIEARSGLGFKYSVQPHFGIIDNQYRGDLGVKMYNLSSKDYHVSKGDKIAQIVFYPIIAAQMSFTDEATESARGEKGFGSSGK